MGIISNKELIANNKLGYIRNLMRTAIEEAYKEPMTRYTVRTITSCYHTMDGPILKLILLATGGVFSIIVNAKVYNCTIHKKSLGVGIYNVYATTKMNCTEPM